MHRITVALLTLSIFISPFVQGALLCRAQRLILISETPIHEGALTPSFDNFSKYETYLLGSGTSGDVFRLEIDGKESRQIKIYRNFQSGYDRDTGVWTIKRTDNEFRHDDELALTGLKKLQKEGVLKGDFVFPDVSVIDVSKNGQKKVALEYSPIYGENLLRIFNNVNIPKKVKDSLYERYLQELQKLATSLHAKINKPNVTPDFGERLNNLELPHLECPVQFTYVGGSTYTTIRIVPDGVIVDALSGNLHIYDVR